MTPGRIVAAEEVANGDLRKKKKSSDVDLIITLKPMSNF